MSRNVPILLLSGMAADEKLFAAQRRVFPDLRVPAWIEPSTRESLPGYAARLARQLDPGRPCVVGGASFGGMVALEMAPHLRAEACVLIGSVRSPAELPWRWRALRPLACLGPDGLAAAGLLAHLVGPWLTPQSSRGLRRLTAPEGRFFRWAVCAALAWRPSPAVRGVRVFQIHGEGDRTLPARRTRADVIVPGGGHALPFTNPSAVNEFLRRVLRSLPPQPTDPEVPHERPALAGPAADPGRRLFPVAEGGRGP